MRLLQLTVLAVIVGGCKSKTCDCSDTDHEHPHTHDETVDTSVEPLPQDCATYCDLVGEACPGLYADPSDCADTCSGFATSGEIGDTDGDTLQCRITWALEADIDPSACEAASEDGGGVCGAPPAPTAGTRDNPIPVDASAATQVEVTVDAGEAVWLAVEITSTTDLSLDMEPSDPTNAVDECNGDTTLSLFLEGNTTDIPDAFNDDRGPDDRCAGLDPVSHPDDLTDVPPGTHLVRVTASDPDHDAGPNDLHIVPFTSGVEGDACSDEPGETCDPELSCFDSVCVSDPSTIDADGDGFASVASGGTDCDDTDAAISPAASEDCDGVDQDCDGLVDDGLPTVTGYEDDDGDGFGTGPGTTSCSLADGQVTQNGDCDDAEATVNPASAEICNDRDDDCDGAVDDGVTGTDYYTDADGDGFGAGAVAGNACMVPSGFSADRTDCDDTLSNVFPGAAETCDGTDEDCSGAADDGPDGDLDGTPDVCDSCPTIAAPEGLDPGCPATSCQQILQAGDSTGNGSYWLDPEGIGAVEATCDMTTDGGGWTRVFGYDVATNDFANMVPSPLNAGLVAARAGSGHVSMAGLAQFRTASGFDELRMHCSKPSVGRTIHITSQDSDVLDWLTATSSVQPDAVGSFTRMPDDDSVVAQSPEDWGVTGGVYFIGRWGHEPPSGGAPDRLTDHTVFVDQSAHWLMDGSFRQECDDYHPFGSTENAGNWSIWVR